jgi:hypothetical protein
MPWYGRAASGCDDDGIMRTRCAALALVGTLAGAAAANAADGCASLPQARVNLQRVYDDPTLDTALDTAALAARTRDARRGDVQLGLTESVLVGGFEVTVDFAPSAPGSPLLCGAAREISVRFGFENVVIHIAREVAGDRCMYDEVYRHELRHVAVDRDMVATYAPRIEAALRTLVATRGVVRALGRDAVAEAVRERVRGALDAVLRSLSRERRLRQRLIDGVEEQRRLGAACGGILPRLLAPRRRAAP